MSYVRKERCPSCGRIAPTWGPEQIIRALQQWDAVHGRTPAAADWKTGASDRPTAATVVAVFGTFDAGRRAAGLTFSRKNSIGHWTEQAIKDAFFRWAFMHGSPPAYRDWNPRPSEEWPTAEIARRMFGTWTGALAAAGYEPRVPRRAVAA